MHASRLILFVFCAHVLVSGRPLPGADSQWEFDGDLESSTGDGTLIELAATPAGNPEVTFETLSINGQDADVAHFSQGTYFEVPHGMAPNGGGGYVNQYTLIMDVMFPARSGFTSLFQTNCCNVNDGDWFINETGGLGVLGVYGGSVPDGEWHRLALVVDLKAGTLTSFVDGDQVSQTTGQVLDDRFALYSPTDTDAEPFETFFVFADENGENSEGYVNSIQFHDLALSPGVIAEIGGPSAGGIPRNICIFPPAVATRDIATFRTAAETNADYLPGDVMDVAIVISDIRAAIPPCTAPAGIVIVETLPAGWAPSQISDGGAHDAGANKITWTLTGPNFTAGKTLTYKVTAAASSEIQLTFDGAVAENLPGAKSSPVRGDSIILTESGFDSCGGIRSWNILGAFTQPANDWPDSLPGAGDNPGIDHMRLDFLSDGEILESDFIWYPGSQIPTAFGGDGVTGAVSTGLQSGINGANPNGVPEVLAWNDRDSFINLNDEVYGGDPNVVMAYLQVYVTNSGPDREVKIGVDSDDAVQVLLNDEEIWINSIARGAGACEFSDKSPDGVNFPGPIILPTGQSKLVVKVFEGAGGFNAQLRFEDPITGEPITDLTISKKPTGLCLTPPLLATRDIGATETVAIQHADHPRWRSNEDYGVSIDISSIRGAGAGCSAPTAVTIEEIVPDGWTPSSPSSGGTISGTKITWSLSGAAIAPGVLTYSVKAPNASGPVTFRGKVSESGTQVTSAVIGESTLQNPSAFNDFCFIKSWLLLGPYAQPGIFGATPGEDQIRTDHLCDGINIAETDVEPRAGDTVDTAYGDCASSTGLRAGATTPINPGGTPTWFAWQDADDTISFNDYYGANLDRLMMYAVTYVHLSEDMVVDIGLDSDDSVQVLLDGSEIWIKDIARGTAGSNAVVDVVATADQPLLNPLSAGVHKIMVKVFEGTADNLFRLRFQDPSTGDPICGGITVCLDPTPEGCATGTEPRFVRGDSDASGDMNITDAVFVLNYLFLGGPAPPCLDSADADDDGSLSITDGVRILNVLFLGTGVIPPPNECGTDPTPEDLELGCENFEACG